MSVYCECNMPVIEEHLIIGTDYRFRAELRCSECGSHIKGIGDKTRVEEVTQDD